MTSKVNIQRKYINVPTNIHFRANADFSKEAFNLCFNTASKGFTRIDCCKSFNFFWVQHTSINNIVFRQSIPRVIKEAITKKNKTFCPTLLSHYKYILL